MTAREAVRARRRQRRRRKALAAGTAVVLVGGGAGTAWAMDRSGTPRYRLATVTTGTVNQVIDSDGSLAAARVADAAFAVSGTVASVAVGVGDHVTAGQRLATMDRASLQAAVTNAQTAVASAKATLTDDEDGTTTTTSTSGGTGGTTSVGGSTGATATTRSAVTPTGAGSATAVFTAARTGPGTPGAGSPLSAQTAKVTAAATRLANALGGELDTLATACAPTTTTSTSTVAAAADDTGSISGSTGTGTTAVSAGGTGVTPSVDGSWTLTGLTAGTSYTVTITQQRKAVDADACSSALDDAQSSSNDVADALRDFGSAVAALTKAADALGTTSGAGTASGAGTGSGSGAKGTGSGSGSGTGGGTTSGAGTGSTGARTGSGTSGSTGAATGTPTGGSDTAGASGASGSASTSTTVVVTSERLAADVAAVASAKAALAVAQNQLASAALTSPVTGTVASVGLSAGGSVSAGSTTNAVEVVADGPLSVQLSIPLSKIDLVKVGQRAQVTVDGHTKALPARVTYVGMLNSSSSNGTSSAYTVTVQLDDTTAGLYDGMGAQVSIAVGTAKNALVVPLSALHTTGTRHTVDVYSDGKSVPTSVSVGVVGADSAQITQGLSVHQQVVLADTAEATPTSTSTTGGFTRGSFGSGAFPGGFSARTGTGSR